MLGGGAPFLILICWKKLSIFLFLNFSEMFKKVLATILICLIVVFPKEVEFAHASDESTRYHV